MSDELIIRHCSPTLAGIKNGNLFTCPIEDKEELFKDIRRLNGLLTPKGLRVLPLRYTKKSALIYVYRPEGLGKELARQDAIRILEQAGYESTSPDRCVIKLINRLKESDEFPHEIGLFLSYPPEDVEGFINNKGKGAKLSGLWKVYGNETAAKEKFDAFKKCTRIYSRMNEAGASLEKLTVADSAVRR